MYTTYSDSIFESFDFFMLKVRVSLRIHVVTSLINTKYLENLYNMHNTPTCQIIYELLGYLRYYVNGH